MHCSNARWSHGSGFCRGLFVCVYLWIDLGVLCLGLVLNLIDENWMDLRRIDVIVCSNL